MEINPYRFRWLPNTMVTMQGYISPDAVMEVILESFCNDDKEHATTLSQRLTSALIANVIISKMVSQTEE